MISSLIIFLFQLKIYQCQLLSIVGDRRENEQLQRKKRLLRKEREII